MRFKFYCWTILKKLPPNPKTLRKLEFNWFKTELKNDFSLAVDLCFCIFWRPYSLVVYLYGILMDVLRFWLFSVILFMFFVFLSNCLKNYKNFNSIFLLFCIVLNVFLLLALRCLSQCFFCNVFLNCFKSVCFFACYTLLCFIHLCF